MSDIASAGQVVQMATYQYRSSWYDRLDARIERLPWPAWVVYLALAAGLLAIMLIVNWSSGVYPAGTIHPFLIVVATSCSYALLAMHYLDRMAADAFKNYHSGLELSDAELSAIQYRLTTMPARPPLACSILSMLAGVLAMALLPDMIYADLKIFATPLTTFIDLSLYFLCWFIGGTWVFHTIHQLREVDRIYTIHTRINLFHPQPLYAFARVAAITACSLFLFTFSWLAPFPQATSLPLQFLLGIFYLILSLAAFIWPLYGIHRLLVRTKMERLGAIGQRLDRSISDLQQHFDNDEHDEAKRAKEMIDSLSAAQRELERIATWPWEPGTIRWLVTALLLPVILWLITHILDRTLRF